MADLFAIAVVYSPVSDYPINALNFDYSSYRGKCTITVFEKSLFILLELPNSLLGQRITPEIEFYGMYSLSTNPI